MAGAAARRVAFPQKVRVSMVRHSYSLEFKDEACRLVMVQKQSISQTARALKIDKSNLKNWLKKRGYSMTVPHELPADTDDPVALKARIRELESRALRAETERDFLKKATAFFAAQSLNDSLPFRNADGSIRDGRSR
jgi:transposase